MTPSPPAQQAAVAKTTDEATPPLSAALDSPSVPYPKANNRRASSCAGQRAYPWLLAISTGVAALFCLMYITKPVIVPSSPMSPAGPAPSPAAPAPLASSGRPAAPAGLMPSGDRLPGEQNPAAGGVKPIPADPRRAVPGPPSTTAFEETNLRVQHILTAEAPGGHVNRIDIDVPVLYQSRNLRWSAEEVAQARTLLIRLMDYQEKAGALRSEGVELLESWNRLIGNSIPASDLRADSPSLPANQEDAADAPRPAGLITTEAIQLQPSGK